MFVIKPLLSTLRLGHEYFPFCSLKVEDLFKLCGNPAYSSEGNCSSSSYEISYLFENVYAYTWYV